MDLSKNIIQNVINEYFTTTRLSLRQVAQKWGLTSSMLSQVRNGKKNVGLDLGLKILRYCGSDIETQKNWLEEELKRNSKVYSAYLDDIKNGKKFKQLAQAGAEYLSSDIRKIYLYLDIASMRESGLSPLAILKHYGEEAQIWTKELLKLNLIELKRERYFIKERNTCLVSHKNATHSIIKKIIESQRTNYINENNSKMNFFIDDFDESLTRELEDLYSNFYLKLSNIYKKGNGSRIKGNKRVTFQIHMNLY